MNKHAARLTHGVVIFTPSNYILYTHTHPVCIDSLQPAQEANGKNKLKWYYFGAIFADTTFSGVFLGFKESLRVQAWSVIHLIL